MAAGAMGHQAKLCTEPGASPHTFDTSSEPFEFVSEGIRKTQDILDTNGIRGTRSHHTDRTRSGLIRVGGPLVFNPSPNDLELWLPRILGSASVGVLAETLQVFGVMVDRVSKVFSYSDCKVSRATFRGQAGGLIELALDIVGISESVGDAGSFPALTLGVAADDAPYVFSDGVITINSSSKEIFDFELVVDNKIEPRFTNSNTATVLLATDRMVTLAVTTPYSTDETALYDAFAGGTAAVLTLTNGAVSSAFTMASWQPTAEAPVADKRDGELRLKLSGACRMTGTTKELVVSNDATP